MSGSGMDSIAFRFSALICCSKIWQEARGLYILYRLYRQGLYRALALLISWEQAVSLITQPGGKAIALFPSWSNMIY
nr:hypothetical protein Q903MT_gene1648 [Picea sitchensis]